jgi:uncharacterized protein (DUF2342 family)
MAGFDAGVPVRGDGPISFVVPIIDAFIAESGFDPHAVRLWVALNEVAHRAMFRVPFVTDHLVDLVAGYAAAIRISPDQLTGLLSGFDPAAPTEGIDPAALEGMFDRPETRSAQAELTAFLGLTAGYRRLLVRRAAGDLLPDLDRLDASRDAARELGEEGAASAMAAVFVDSDSIDSGRRFCEEVERRYGDEALVAMWTLPNRFPNAGETADPVAWAARVLLEDLG